jgi:isoleucyl-tRNA synthetase
MSRQKTKDYSETLQLPKTSFSMRANLLQNEPRHQERWARMDLYRRILEKEAPQGPYVFHDGPPYANGPIHMGHLLNKILKDLVVRSRIMSGRHVHYVPGWDCHGLPIEHKVLKEMGVTARELDTLEIRRRCHEYAARYVCLQSQQMQRLGTLADYEHPYLTMDPPYEGAVLEVFAALVGRGLVYRDVKPVHWSIANQTALAEAELEYYDRTDTSIFVLFPVEDTKRLPPELNAPAEGRDVYLMIWTTTPWTLPANLAVTVAPEADYALYRVRSGRRERFIILAEALAARVLPLAEGAVFEMLGTTKGKSLVESGVRYRHPFIDRAGVVTQADYVSLEEGTGLVHTAPGHGAEDYYTGLEFGLPIYCPVRADGTFDESVPDWLQGKDVWTANELIINRLKELGVLYHAHEYLHSYPHDWRSKTPTIFRATEQWFIAVDRPFGPEQKSLRERALEAAQSEIGFVPDWGRSRLLGMLEARPDWCISRQRAWGLPIPAFFDASGKVLLTERSVRAVARVIRARGSDHWFVGSPRDLLGDYDPTEDPEAPDRIRAAGSQGLEELNKGEDIFDVWFESGSSWNAVLRERNIGYPADLYLEGSDQHRGWFQLSLLLALGVTGRAPFRVLLTHGFMVDGQGRKMSKSLGNTIEVDEVLAKHGTDVCRWWVSSLNYTNDIKVDWGFFEVAAEEYRKVRNTIRFLLGNLNDFDASSQDGMEVAPDTLDGWALDRLSGFLVSVREGYHEFQFKRVADAVFNFCNEDLSAVYLAAVKDRLYCDAAESPRRRRTQAVMHRIASALIRSVAPILVHTAEEAWLALQREDFENSDLSVHLELLPEPFEYHCDSRWSDVMSFRDRVLKQLEAARTGELGLKNPLDAGIRARVSPGLFDALQPFKGDLVDLCGVSRLYLEPGSEERIEVLDLRDQPRCERSWKRDETVRRRSDGSWLSDRDAAVLSLD